MTILYICEKPSQARDIAKVLGAHKRHEHYLEGSEIKVTWCLGHLLETAWPEHYCPDINPWRMERLPVIPTQWQLLPVSRTKPQLSAIKKLVKETQHVVIATDADREGEVIARELLDYFKFQGKIQRLWLSALDEASIRKALAQLKADQETKNLYYAGLGRQRADWLIGLNMTMATTCLFRQGKGALSVGRVQTPTLNLVVKRDEDIEQFKPKDYFILLAQFINAKGEAFWTRWQIPERETDEQGHCLNKTIIETFAAKIAQQIGVIEQFAQTPKKQAPPLGLSLSGLQKLASSRFGFSAKKTLDVAQALYETHKATTYPRTDCNYLPESQFQEAGIILNRLKSIYPEGVELINHCNTSLKSPIWNDKKITAHHAIIPTTHAAVNLNQFSEDERKLYEMIVRTYVAQFLGDYEYVNRTVAVRCQGELFKASSNTPLKPGWKQALQDMPETKKTEEDDHLSLIPLLTINESVNHHNTRVEAKQTKPPARFTEGTLIEAMKTIGKSIENPALKKILKETAGIGTEATRAAIIETLIKREYLARKGKQLISTDKGRQLIHLLPLIVTDPVMTAHWEQELDAIAQGTQKLASFLIQQTEILQTMLAALTTARALRPPLATSDHSAEKHALFSCPDCQQPLLRRQNKKDKRYFWGCSQYPTCKCLLPDNNGQPGSPKPKINTTPTDIPCPVCKQGQLQVRQGKRGEFLGCNTYPKCRHTQEKSVTVA